MSRSALVKTFSTWERGPIDIEAHVQPEIVKFGLVDEIWFWPDPKLNPGIIRGEIEHWEWPNAAAGTVTRCVDITYSDQLPNDWQRLVCCKELLHVLDPIGTNKPDDIEALVEKIILPADLQDPFNDGHHVNSDRVAITFATAVLFPLAARNIFMTRYAKKEIGLPRIAEKMEIPIRQAATVMSDIWPEIHALLTD